MGGNGSFVRRNPSGGWELSGKRIGSIGGGTRETELGMGGIGAFVRRKWGEGWEGTERLYGAVGEKSIDFRKILYRLFRKTL